MICDEMGLGKTVQGIAIACAFKSKWPLLVIVPSSLKQNWKKEFIKWLPPDQQQHAINIIETSKNIKISDINIISYDLVSNVIDILTKAKFKVVIADESHYIKNTSSQRSQAVVPLIKSSQHRILLSGTPALSRPAELWPQLEAVGVPIFSSFHQFGLRYCAAWQGPQGWDYSGSSNLSELHTILNEAVMIRRLKDEVLTELPKKERKTVDIEPDSEITNKIKSKISHYKQIDLKDNKTKALMAETFMLTGQAKIKGVIKYIIGLLKEDIKAKLIVFAHHVEVLENIQSYLKEQYIPFIKIDGSVDQSLRQTLLDRFQQSTLDSPKVALMSLTCGSFGFTMTAASRVIFTELWWTPGLLLQAEDRAHRIGRKDNSPVKIDYCLAKGTMDDLMWPLLSKKLSIIGQALNGEQTRMEIKSDQKLLTLKDNNSVKLSPILKKEVKTSAIANKNPKKSAVKKAIQTKSTINRRNTLDNYFQKKAENKENQSDNITNYPKSSDRRQSIGKPIKEPIAFVYRDPCALFRQARPTTKPTITRRGQALRLTNY
jgi:SWI/SNF-related matrix-associated actin-dependent regulator 1 of chromatin subfamily A